MIASAEKVSVRQVLHVGASGRFTASRVAWSSPRSIMSTTRSPVLRLPVRRSRPRAHSTKSLLHPPATSGSDQHAISGRGRHQQRAQAAAQSSANLSRPRKAASGKTSAETHRQSGFAAAQRADDVGDGPNIAELELFAAPRPRQLKSDAGLCRWHQQTRQVFKQVFKRRRLTFGEAGPKATDLVGCTPQARELIFKHRLVRGQGRLQTFGVAFHHLRDLREAQSSLRSATISAARVMCCGL